MVSHVLYSQHGSFTHQTASLLLRVLHLWIYNSMPCLTGYEMFNIFKITQTANSSIGTFDLGFVKDLYVMLLCVVFSPPPHDPP